MSLREPSLSERQAACIEAFEALLADPGVRRGMISAGDVERLRERHIADSLRGATALPASGVVCDLGSGGGLPGVPLAIARPELGFVLAERRGNRAAFLRLVVGSLDLPNAEIHHGDVRRLPRRFSACTARAFADAAGTWATAEPLLLPGGMLVYWAGATFNIADAALPGVRAEAFAPAEVAGSGPLVIMSPQ